MSPCVTEQTTSRLAREEPPSSEPTPVWSGIVGDYRMHLERKRIQFEAQGRQVNESRLARRLLAAPRMLLNPGLRMTMVLRFAGACPPFLLWFFRNWLVAGYGCDLAPGPKMAIGPGLLIPHPIGICISRRIVIGSNVVLSHHVSIGGDGRSTKLPVIGDGAFIGPGAVVVGDTHVGAGAMVQANTVLARDLEPGAVHRG